MREKLDFVFTIDGNFLPHFSTALTSLLETNYHLVGHVFLIYDPDEVGGLDILIDYYKKKYGKEITLVEFDSSVFDGFQIHNYFTKSVYFRLLVEKLIPDVIESIVYLDSDIIIHGGLEYFLTIDFKKNNVDGVNKDNDDYYLYAVDHSMPSNDLAHLRNSGFSGSKYFNSGVMFINLKKWRCDAASQLLLSNADKYAEYIKWVDQDILNITFLNQWGELDYIYNAFFLTSKSKENLKIIHFTGSSKPWHLNDTHPYKSLYWKYRNMTPYKSFLPDDFCLSEFYKWFKRKTIKRIMALRTF